MGDDKIVVLIGFYNDESVVMKTIETVQQKLKAKMGITATIGIGDAYEEISKIYLSYRGALDALNYKVFTGKGSLIHINSFDVDGKVSKYYYPVDKEMKLMNAIKRSDANTALNIVNEVYEGIPKSVDIVSYIPEILWQLMNGIFRGMSTMGISYQEVFGENFFETYQGYRSIEDIEGMKIFIEEKISILANYINRKRKNKNKATIIEAIKTYIEKHYAEEISLEIMASKVYMSPSYISTLFKEVTGESFTDYIIKVRMNKAKEFLITEDKDISFIAGMVGYDNVRSFMRAFKKYMGMTPTEYKRLHAIDRLSTPILQK